MATFEHILQEYYTNLDILNLNNSQLGLTLNIRGLHCCSYFWIYENKSPIPIANDVAELDIHVSNDDINSSFDVFNCDCNSGLPSEDISNNKYLNQVILDSNSFKCYFNFAPGIKFNVTFEKSKITVRDFIVLLEILTDNFTININYLFEGVTKENDFYVINFSAYDN